MKRIAALIFALALFCTGISACAMPIQLTGDAVILSATAVADGSAAQLTLDAFNLMAKNADGSYLIHDGKALYNVDAATLGMVIDIPADVPALGALKTIARGELGNHVIPLQQGLKDLGYLAGSADGDYGTGTERAVSTFQTAMGLESTGTADELTQLLITSLLAEPLSFEGKADPEAVFAPILDRTDADLSPILESGLTLTYDDFTGEGFITDGRVTHVDLSGAAELDKYEINVCFGILTREEGEGVTLQPAAKISCLCVRRPVMSTMTLKAGDQRGEADFEALSVRLDGIYTVEEGIVLLTDQMTDALASADEAGELKLRITGQYQTFDVLVNDPAPAALIGRIAQDIRE